jgi:hypothetical protein
MQNCPPVAVPSPFYNSCRNRDQNYGTEEVCSISLLFFFSFSCCRSIFRKYLSPLGNWGNSESSLQFAGRKVEVLELVHFFVRESIFTAPQFGIYG